ncbi:hypothetical protein [Nocardia takedensis]|uniref:hypothetical protein n=1 Tax=Nocardia takedensis TaxID=259390 RepID=UPI000592F2AF|nr:hypothetical protein [Nocardia takedensis]
MAEPTEKKEEKKKDCRRLKRFVQWVVQVVALVRTVRTVWQWGSQVDWHTVTAADPLERVLAAVVMVIQALI